MPSEVVAVIEVRHQNLQRTVGVALRRRNRLYDRFEQWLQVLTAALNIRGGRARLGVGIKDGKLELIFLGVEIDEQIVDLVQHFLGRASARSILLMTTMGGSLASSALPST